MSCFDLAAIGLHLASLHTSGNYNDFNPGVYAETRCGFIAGVFDNSYRHPAVQLGWRAETEKLPVFVELGAATGYPGHDVLPYAMLGVKLGPVRIGVIPHVAGFDHTNVIHAMVQFKF